MSGQASDWSVFFDRRNIIIGRAVRDVTENLSRRPAGPRAKTDDDVFGPLNTAMAIAVGNGDYRLAIDLFHGVMPHAQRFEDGSGSVLHKGAPTFNVGVAYLRDYDFRA